MITLVRVVQRVLEHPLNRDHKLKALVRFARWQIASRILGQDVAYEWISGAKFFARTGETGLTGNIYCGLHEFEEMGFLLHLLRPDDLFVDVAGNVVGP